MFKFYLNCILTLFSFFKFTRQQRVCPRAFYARISKEGIGDQIERYTYASYIAFLLDAQLVNANVRNSHRHKESYQYKSVAKFLGIYSNISLSNIFVNVSSATRRSVTHAKALQMQQSNKKPCNVIYESSITSCGGRWCSWTFEYLGMEAMAERFQENNSPQKCLGSGLGFEKRRNKLDILFHVRKGDACLHCDDVDYFKRVYTILKNTTKTFQHLEFNLVFESERPIPFLNNTFPDSRHYVGEANLLNTVCRMLTSDILVAGGSSFPPMIAMFASKRATIVFEDSRKESHTAPAGHVLRNHFFRKWAAILMENGNLLLPVSTAKEMVERVLRDSKVPPQIT